MLVSLESPGMVCWQQLQEQVARISYSQPAAVFQHSPPRVGTYSLVYAASLSPVGRHFKTRRRDLLGRTQAGEADFLVGIPVDLQSSAVAAAEQLVGNELRKPCTHRPAALHLPLSKQHAPRDGGRPPTYSWRPTQIQYQLQLM